MKKRSRRVLDPCVRVGRFRSIGEVAGHFHGLRVSRLDSVVDAQDEFPLPLSNGMLPPERRFFPKLLQRVSEMEFVERTNVDKIRVFTRDASGVGVFLDKFMRAGPFAEASDGLFVRSANCVFQREAAAEHERTQVIAEIELMAALRQTADEAVRAPVLPDRSEVSKAAWRVLGQVLCALLVTPNDVPLGIGEIRSLESPFVARADVSRYISILYDCRQRSDSRLHKR